MSDLLASPEVAMDVWDGDKDEDEERRVCLECGWTGCGQVFGRVELLVFHLREVHLFASQQCDQPLHCFWHGCGGLFDAIHHKHLTVHLLYHAYHTHLKELGRRELNMKREERVPQCQLITLSSSVPPDLPPEGFTCLMEHGHCGENFDSFHSFLVHVKSHIYTPALKERVCSWMDCERTSSFKTKFTLQLHMQVHTGAKQFACPQCGACFANSSKLKGHCVRQIIDESTKCYKCSFCNLNFAANSLLREHLRTHVKLYQCSQCSIPFASKSALRNHWKFKHSEERLFPCPMNPCKYAAKTQNDLLKHLKNHEQKSNVLCKFCDERFRTVYSYQCHAESQHKVRAKNVYVCHICDLDNEVTFPRGIYLSRHLMTKHNMQRPLGQKFSYMRAEDGRYYLAQEEYHEMVELGEAPTEVQMTAADGEESPLYSSDMPLNCVISSSMESTPLKVIHL